MPETIPLALRWCELIVSADGTYAEALKRALSYFLTDINLAGVSDDETDRWKSYLNDTLGIWSHLQAVGMDFMTYGNGFFSVLPLFERHLQCKGCQRVRFPLRVVYNAPVFSFSWEDYQFKATCPQCRYRGPWLVKDNKITDERKAVLLRRWSPHEIELLWDPFTHQCRYLWKIPEDYKSTIRKGHLHQLERVPLEVLDAISANQYLLFDDDVILHVKEPTLAGIRNRGWGIPRILSNFRQTWYVQVLRRFNEAIALDYVIPFRILTPAPGDSATGKDPLMGMGGSSTVSHIRRMLRQRRQNPAMWHVLPFSLQYQLLGGEAKQMAPVELIAQGQETQLANIGIPMELWKGSLSVQAAPAALRLFESSWTALPRNLNMILQFIVRNIAKIMSWQCPQSGLEPVTHADDITTQQAVLQLMMGGQVSPTTGLKAIRKDFRTEVKRTLDDERFRSELQARTQREMQAGGQMEQMVQQMGQPFTSPGGQSPAGPGGAGGAASAAGGQAPAGPAGQAAQSVAASLTIADGDTITPQDMWSRADTAAQQLLTMPESQRQSELRKIKQVNPNIHPYVLQRVEAYRDDAARQGRDMVLQQNFGNA